MYSIFYSLAELFFIFQLQTLMVCCISAAFACGFSLLPVELQELSYSVKGYLFERREAVWCRPEGHRLQL